MFSCAAFFWTIATGVLEVGGATSAISPDSETVPQPLLESRNIARDLGPRSARSDAFRSAAR